MQAYDFTIYHVMESEWSSQWVCNICDQMLLDL